jgi:hypothetical protein
MRALIVLATLALASLGASVAAANAAQFGIYGGGPGSLMSACRPSCGVVNSPDFVPPHARKCVFKCIAAKKAAQH